MFSVVSTIVQNYELFKTTKIISTFTICASQASTGIGLQRNNAQNHQLQPSMAVLASKPIVAPQAEIRAKPSRKSDTWVGVGRQISSRRFMIKPLGFDPIRLEARLSGWPIRTT
ncbi:hypothetical protein [Lysobacter firmicutimachus]|uniref:Uncharacterized protein n=1 Tax=Lysobacter firmicutimachus TaxID=1792846 RepID=A0ABU8D504_9GAMM